MKYLDFIDLKYKPAKTDIICEFFIEPQGSIREAAGAVASESSIGTWTEVTTMQPGIEKLAAKVFSINGNIVKIAYPYDLFEPDNIPQILSSIAGNIFGMKNIKNLRLEDIHFPEKLIKHFSGPLYGVEGIRKMLHVHSRPLVGTIVKPKLGLDAKQHAEVAFQAWLGGCDIVKDDENLSDQKFNHFQERVLATLRARDLAEKVTGERKIYMPNVTAETREMVKRVGFVKKSGGEYVMIDIISSGWSALQTLADYNKISRRVLHAHRAGHGMLTRNKKHGMSMLVIAKLCRLIGLDQLHIGTAIGKMEGPSRDVLAIDQEIEKMCIYKNPASHVLEQKWFHLKPMFAVCSGGLHPGHVPFLIKHLGKNIIMQFGGGIHGHPKGTAEGARAVRQAVDATMRGISLEEYAKKNSELREALDFFEKVK